MEKRRVIAGFDEVALGVDQKQPGFGAFDLPANNDRSVKTGIGAFAGLGLPFNHFAQGVADQSGHLKHRRQPQDRGRAVRGGLHPLVDQADQRLRGGKVPGGQDGDAAFAIFRPSEHLAIGGNIVQPRIGPGIGHEHKAPFQH